MTKKLFSPISFVALFGSGIRYKHPGSAALKLKVKNCTDIVVSNRYRMVVRNIKKSRGPKGLSNKNYVR
jgi:hypothetical protein